MEAAQANYTGQPTLSVNGFRAKVLSDKREAFLTNSGGSFTKVDYPKSGVAVRKLLARAEAESYDRLEVVRSRYVTYDLNSIMRQRSGTVLQITVYKRDAFGKWQRSVEVSKDLA